MDMLVVGMYGKGDNNAVALGGCTDTEYRSHFSLWAIMNSPLMIGCDIRNMKKEAAEILTNKNVIALNQDGETRGPYCIRQWNNPEKVMAFVKPLSNGDFGIGMFNFSETASEMSLQFWDLGLSAAAGKGMSLYDCWEHKEVGIYGERYVCRIEPHGCRVFRGKVTNLQ